MRRIKKRVAWVVVGLAGVPLLLHFWLTTKDQYYDELVQRYECNPGACQADFTEDGRPEQVERVKRSPTSIDESLVVKDGDHELLRLPYEYVDGSLRTHVALRTEAGRSTLLIFDGTGGGEPQRKALRWTGKGFVEVTPSREETKILTAMAARDNTGSWIIWGLYRTFFVPFLLAYYTLFVLVVSLIIVFRWRSGRTSKVP